ncbi:MAG TPA: excinuclease ABC subunit UvrC [Bacteroidota bacterium]|nr:excinuclease ABC subunit UvrC [Bacteroidota bacterium]
MPQEPQIRLSTNDVSLADKLENLPTSPGVYQYKDKEGKILYVGKAINLRNRVRSYFHKSRALDPRIALMISKAVDVELITTDSEVEALILEANLIKLHKPRYNVNLKDDRSYPYIVITNEPYPRVFVTRRIRRDGSKYFGPYTDVHTVRSALKTVRDIFMIRSCNFMIDEEFIEKRKTRVCLDYHIKKCEGPCEGLISRERYNEMILQVEKVLEGKTNVVIDYIQKQMEDAAAAMKFEDAALYRDRIRELEVYSSKQKVVDVEQHDRDFIAVANEADDACGVIFKVREGKLLGRRNFYLNGTEAVPDAELISALVKRYYLDAPEIPEELVVPVHLEDEAVLEEWLTAQRKAKVSLIVPEQEELTKLLRMCGKNAKFLLDELKLQKMKQKDFIPHAVQSLQRDLRLTSLPRKIECFDISHFQGTETVASMVVFEDGKPKKSEYRKFKIKSVAPKEIDDFASMREVVRRRYTRLKEEQMLMPDLIVIDGGKGQLSSAVEILHSLDLDHQPIISLAKRLEEVFLPHESEPVMIPKSSTSLRLLQQVRDEAHRFAITFHRSLRDKRTLQTELDLIKGIGSKRAKELLETFGSVQGVRFATPEQLSEVVGEKVAAKIAEYFSAPDEITEDRPAAAAESAPRLPLEDDEEAPQDV